MSIQPGNLVKTRRPFLDLPKGSVGFVTGTSKGTPGIIYYDVKLQTVPQSGPVGRRFLRHHLEVLSASR